MAADVRHEAQHADAASRLGAKDLFYGVDIVAASEEAIIFHALFRSTTLTTTKLGMAIINCCPIDPSPCDIDKVIQMGYSGAADVAERALDHNYSVLADKTRNDFYPVPLNYSGAAIRYAANYGQPK